MATTTILDVQDQIQKFWSPMFMKELREDLLLGALVNKEYQGAIQNEGDTVHVSQINAPTGALKTVGVDADTFSAEKLSTTRVSIVADKRAVAAFEFTDLAYLQSQIGSKDSEIRESLRYAMEKQINNYLYTLVAPATAHALTGVATFTAADLSHVRKLAAKAKWLKAKGFWGLLSPDYYGDLLDAQTMSSKDYIGDEMPVVGGQIVNKRYGFNLLEDNSRTSKGALFFHPDFMHLVMQTQATFKLSDLHAQNKFGYLLSVDLVFGAKLGIAGDKKHITVAA